MRSRSFALNRLVLALMGLAACGGDSPTETSTGPTTGPDTTPSTVTASAGGGETARVGTSVATPPSVVIRNAGGQVLAGVQVTFSVESGGGSTTGSATTTDANGVARVGGWTLGPTAGENLLKAAVTTA